MRRALRHFADFINVISDRMGSIFSFLVLVIMVITTVDVIARYVFNEPLIWGWVLNRLLFGVFTLFAGIYAMNKKEHIRIEIIYDHFPPKIKFIARMIALGCFILFMSVLVWQSSWMGWNSWNISEKAAGTFRIPLYPFKILIPILAFLFLLEGIVKLSSREDD
jgi:TRAP-type mannitol/chloroaromatic compound transport system permease small subunit